MKSNLRTFAILAALLVLVVAGGTAVEHFTGQNADRPGSDASAGPVVGEVGTCAGVATSAPRHLLGMWLTTVLNIDWPSQPGLDEQTVKQEYLGWLDLAQRLHHNAIWVHVRPSGDAFWPSQFAPWSEWLTGKRDGVSPGWDPMAWMVEQTHARNIEFHAWFNPYRGTQPAPKGPGADMNAIAPNHPLKLHPEWAVAYPKGASDSRLYFDPGIPDARKFVEDSMLEAVQKYDIDGVDFDDFFYPYPETGAVFDDDASYAKYGKNFSNKADWRRDNVNTMIREMNERIKALKPWVKFGISPFGIWRNSTTDPTGSPTNGLQSYDAQFADTRLWVKQHWIDYIMPQLYWTIGFEAADYAKLIAWWSTVADGTGVQLVVAQGDYRIGEPGAWSDPAELDRQIALADQYHAAGTVHFSAKDLREDRLGAVSKYTADHYPTVALPPTMPRLPVRAPATPVLTAVRAGSDHAVTVTWRAGTGTAATSYAVYRLDTGASTARLIDTVRATGPEQSIVDKDPAAVATSRYCVSGVDRSANEGRISLPMAVGT